MTAGLLYALAGGVLFALGLHGVLAHPNLIRKILGYNIMGSGAFLALVGLAQRGGALDPVPHAMVLTGIVVTVSATGLALIIARRIYALTGATHFGDEPED